MGGDRPIAAELPDDVQALLRAHVESYEHLAVLLLAYRQSTRTWSVADLSSTLSIPEQLAEAAVTTLRNAGLLRAECDALPPSYRYAANSAAHATIARLASEYAENPVQVVRLMSANAIERVRMSALHAFADAFVLKKDKDRG